jgi:hypothetical protein
VAPVRRVFGIYDWQHARTQRRGARRRRLVVRQAICGRAGRLQAFPSLQKRCETVAPETRRGGTNFPRGLRS